jgi:hypothetical protein
VAPEPRSMPWSPPARALASPALTATTTSSCIALRPSASPATPLQTLPPLSGCTLLCSCRSLPSDFLSGPPSFARPLSPSLSLPPAPDPLARSSSRSSAQCPPARPPLPLQPSSRRNSRPPGSSNLRGPCPSRVPRRLSSRSGTRSRGQRSVALCRRLPASGRIWPATPSEL